MDWDLLLFVIAVLITGLFWKKASERILIWGLVFLFTIPAAGYLLNGGLYEKDKVFIPFLPLLCYVTAYYIKNTADKRRKLRPNKNTLSAAICGCHSFIIYVQTPGSIPELLEIHPDRRSGNIYRILPVSVPEKTDSPPSGTSVMRIPVQLLYDLSQCRRYGCSARLFQELTSSGISDLVSSIDDKLSGFRLEQIGTHTENSANFNRIHAGGQKISSMYSSACNPYYRTFREQTFELEQPYRNCLMQGVSTNPLFRRLMGVKYIISKDTQFGYQKLYTQDGLTLWENKDVAPLAYVTDRLVSEQEYESLDFPYSQLIFSQAGVVPQSSISTSTASARSAMKVNDVTFTIPHQAGSALDIQAVENGYEIHAAKEIQN